MRELKKMFAKLSYLDSPILRPGSEAEIFMSRLKLFRPADMIQTPILISAELG